jgi:hypothetical protein
MKKFYLGVLTIGTASISFAQSNQKPSLNQYENQREVVRTNVEKPQPSVQNKAIYWTETFDIGAVPPGSTGGPNFTTPNGTWTANGTNGNIWKHSFYTTSGEWSTGTPDFNSTTASDGFMLFDADSMNNEIAQGNQNLYQPFTGSLVSPQIDLTGAASALLSIQQDFRFCCFSTHDMYVQVSTDDGATWSAPYDLVGSTAVNTGFYGSNGNNYVQYANISGLATGNIVRLKFTWDGAASANSHYFWVIDDINIETLPPDDIQVVSSYIAGENNTGLEYGRTPIDQTDDNYYVGTVIYNFGANDQTNVVSTNAYTGASTFTATGNLALIESDSTYVVETLEPMSFVEGTYAGVHTVTSSGEQPGGPEFGNNTGARQFAIGPSTSSQIFSQYSLDGIGVYTNSTLSSLGTNSFTSATANGEDGIVLTTLYNIKQTCSPIGIRVMLATGTETNGEVYASILDTALFWAQDMTPLYPTIVNATITTPERLQGYKDFYFATAPVLPPGAYYAAAELYSQAGTNVVRIQDDETVEQPGDASAIYIPVGSSAGVYSNGTAFGIRLLFGSLNVEENALSTIRIYPNPTEGVLYVSNETGSTQTIEIFDMLGNLIDSRETSAAAKFDLTNVAAGVYTVKVSNTAGSITESVVIK